MTKKKVLFVSSILKDSKTGGANAVNFHIYEELQKYFDCDYARINPIYSRWDKLISNINRKVLKRPGSFFFFSNKRLRRIQEEFKGLRGDYDLVFFKGVTPWVLCKPEVPYFLYCDVGFKQFFENTFSPEYFIKKDIDRILSLEEQWLTHSSGVFFESEWGLRQTAKTVEESDHFMAVGRGGSIPLPKEDNYSGGLGLLVIANDFYQKGGDLSFKAMKALLPKYPNLKLHVIGGPPPEAILNDEVVEYHGRFNKEDPEELKRMTEIIGSAFLLMHVTREDINPLVPSEVGYFGCPTISVNRFAIPELVVHGKTGYLCDSYQISEVAGYLEALIKDKVLYMSMRHETFQWNRSSFSWGGIGKTVSENLNALFD